MQGRIPVVEGRPAADPNQAGSIEWEQHGTCCSRDIHTAWLCVDARSTSLQWCRSRIQHVSLTSSNLDDVS